MYCREKKKRRMNATILKWNQWRFLCFVVEQYELIECETVTIFQVVAFWWLRPFFFYWYVGWNSNSIDRLIYRRKEICIVKKISGSINGISDEEAPEMNRCKYLCGRMMLFFFIRAKRNRNWESYSKNCVTSRKYMRKCHSNQFDFMMKLFEWESIVLAIMSNATQIVDLK